jgi:hypothetical protein
MSREIPLAFVLTTEARSGHPHSEYTHVCEATLLGRLLWSRWGRTAEEAERAAEFEIESRVASALRRGSA